MGKYDTTTQVQTRYKQLLRMSSRNITATFHCIIQHCSTGRKAPTDLDPAHSKFTILMNKEITNNKMMKQMPEQSSPPQREDAMPDKTSVTFTMWRKSDEFVNEDRGCNALLRMHLLLFTETLTAVAPNYKAASTLYSRRCSRPFVLLFPPWDRAER